MTEGDRQVLAELLVVQGRGGDFRVWPRCPSCGSGFHVEPVSGRVGFDTFRAECTGLDCAERMTVQVHEGNDYPWAEVSIVEEPARGELARDPDHGRGAVSAALAGGIPGASPRRWDTHRPGRPKCCRCHKALAEENGLCGPCLAAWRVAGKPPDVEAWLKQERHRAAPTPATDPADEPIRVRVPPPHATPLDSTLATETPTMPATATETKPCPVHPERAGKYGPGLCMACVQRWKRAGEPDVERWAANLAAMLRPPAGKQPPQKDGAAEPAGPTTTHKPARRKPKRGATHAAPDKPAPDFMIAAAAELLRMARQYQAAAETLAQICEVDLESIDLDALAAP